MVPNIPKRNGDNGYRIRVDRLPTDYVPGQEYRVLLQSTTPVSFREFFLVATKDSAPNEAAGDFVITDRLKVRFSRTCSRALTHTFSSSKTSISAQWLAPPAGAGCVNFRAGVIQKKTVWFAEDGDLTLQLCERESTGSGPAPPPTLDPHACCAPPHEEAKYRFTFVSTWTPQTHPRQYPTGNGNHWSDLIGASHGSDYTIWEYGQYASYGIKMVAEWGSPYRLEREIKEEGDNVKTVIFSRGLFPAYGPRLRNMTSYFKTDSQRNLVSAVSMMGPSPDWCVGISKENLCTADCGWVERKVFYLQPWDAGTDSGIMYNSSNSPLDPPDPIRPITSSDPDNPRASFYNPNGGPIGSLATVVIERVSIRNRSNTETEHGTGSQGGVHGGMPPKKPMMGGNPTMPPKVMGQPDPTMPPKVMGGHDPTMPPKVMGGHDLTMPPKVMGRPDLTMPPKVMGGRDPTMPSKVMVQEPTMPPKQMGVITMPPKTIEIIPEGDIQTMPPKRRGKVVDCMMTAWGEWSECSKSCGKGKMLRQRMIKQRPRNGGEECGQTKERQSCNVARCTSVDRDCRMSEWGPWSDCSVSCGGEMGIEFRMRDVARRARGDGAPCDPLKEMRACSANPC
eukprot:XP_791634.3 PREDICTED: spondin-1 [Strongylocentrotus purpuratus]